jgi:hypothetical protein
MQFLANTSQATGTWGVALLASIVGFAAQAGFNAEDIVVDANEDRSRLTASEIAPSLVADVALILDIAILVAAATARWEAIAGTSAAEPRVWMRQQVSAIADAALRVLRALSDARFRIESRPTGEPTGGGQRMLVYGYRFDSAWISDPHDTAAPGRDNTAIIERVRTKMRQRQNSEFPTFIGVPEVTEMKNQAAGIL